jgi:hypothetical protein
MLFSENKRPELTLVKIKAELRSGVHKISPNALQRHHSESKSQRPVLGL